MTARILLGTLACLFTVATAAPVLATGGGGGTPLDLHVLVTNDDGFDSEGIQAVAAALAAAGHTVTVVGPATQQSGKGGSINTGVLDFTIGEGTRMLVNYGGGVWSFDGSPSDTVAAALEIVLADDPPDLIVSGLNEGQNLGKPGSNASGTVGAALRGTFSGIPAIAGSMEILFQEAQTGFPSTVASYEPAAEFIARMIDELTVANGTRILPKGVRMMNVNFPVPYEEAEGVAITRLGDTGLVLPRFDPSQGYPALGVPPLPFPSCADAAQFGGACFVSIGVDLAPADDPVKGSDTTALANDKITITPMNADMTAGAFGQIQTFFQLGDLTP